jgi:hypothetical protein
LAKPDDSSLNPRELRAIEKRAGQLLDRASGWNVFPTPVDDLVAAAKLRVAPSSMFDASRLLSFLRDRTEEAAHRIKSALSKVLGLYDAHDQVIHIDDTVQRSRQNFLKLHETGHHEIPSHRGAFGLFQDCEKTLAPEVADLFEREANNFARFVLFQGDTFQKFAKDSVIGIRTPVDLSKKFGASVYAATREYVRTNPKSCLVFILEPVVATPGGSACAVVRRVEASTLFRKMFDLPQETKITLDHQLGPTLPIGRRMTKARPVVFHDRNGLAHECLAEAFDTTFNVLVLVYPVRALTAKSVTVTG